MAKEFKGISKEQHEQLTKAVTVYANITGEKVDIGNIPVAEAEEADAKAAAKAAEKELKEQAELTAKLEESTRAQRRLQMGQTEDGEEREPIKTALRKQQERGTDPQTVSAAADAKAAKADAKGSKSDK